MENTLWTKIKLNAQFLLVRTYQEPFPDKYTDVV